MAKRMLIDATQPEETRVAVLNGNRLEELDFEIASKKQLKGNIYLAKVTRVEPSLQAAFIDYGGNRHGFLAFSEIHPDYYRIPVADREKLLALDELDDEDDEEEADDLLAPAPSDSGEGEIFATPVGLLDEQPADAAPVIDPAPLPEMQPEAPVDGEPASQTEPAPALVEAAEATAPADELGDEDADRRKRSRRRQAILRQYKIQEVIKRNQIVLIQVVKEERGNKGAALTTYLSLAGRYCVLMPNTGRGGGVSRKITNPEDRRRMKALIDQLTVPDGMSVILRTAGMERSHTDIQRDLDTITRLWDGVREEVLKATAPSLVHEEANLIRRAMRDLYSRDIATIDVEGDGGYRMAKDFMRLMLPAAARKVQHYRDPAVPLFVRHRLESQIEALYNSTVTLKSGGYIVINPTEALVAIDVNSGRSTRERNIEETALRTNLEAADEVGRQLRLRDLAGLIVVDFIDMEDSRHNAQVERRMREAMKTDRARVQIGRISPFGLLELSRQRLHPSLVETNFTPCPHCAGSGHMRNTESAALHILRSVEEEGLQQKASELGVNVASEVSLYILNHKRATLADIERRYGIKVFIHGDEELKTAEFKIERVKARQPGEFKFPEAPPPEPEDDPILPEGEDEEAPPPEENSGSMDAPEGEYDNPRRGRRWRGRGRGRDRHRDRGDQPPREGEQPQAQPVEGGELQPAGLSHEGQIIQDNQNTGEPPQEGGFGERRGRRRGRRGGRGRFRDRNGANGQAAPYPPDMPQPGFGGYDDQPVLTSADLPLPSHGGAPMNSEGGSPGNERAPEGQQDQQGQREGGREGRRHRGGRGRGRDRFRNREGGQNGQGGERRERHREGGQPTIDTTPRTQSDIKIVSEFRAREPVSNTPPPPSSSANINPPSDKPKGGWWKKLIGTE